jgi:uncharacterized protein
MSGDRIRLDVLRDRRFPVHGIADRLLPFLRVLVEQFQPEQVVLFGSYASGRPGEDSDVDLLVVKPIKESRLKDKLAIRRAWWPLLRAGHKMSFDLLLVDPAENRRRAESAGSFHRDILEQGLRLV